MKAVVAMHQDEDGMWIAECLSMPGCVSEGASRAEALKMLQDAMQGWLAVMREDHPGIDLPLLAVEVSEIEVAA
ncbi:type II toxin-antitoxin system HicB family antitoxin [bacterium]|nr:type II toxin-antitoxin system HicB family antitoxin [bacterium]